MSSPAAFYRWTELDRASYPEFRDRIAAFLQEPVHAPPRSYPGYPKFDLEKAGPRRFASIDQALFARRSVRSLPSALPSRADLSRLLRFAHGVSGPDGRGPVPSAGGLQALELYVVVLTPDWLPAGAYHYDRAGHHLSQVLDRAEDWPSRVPSLEQTPGGGLLFVVAGDEARVAKKYGARGSRFLLLEAGHLMQNLCLVATTLDLAVVPMGGFFEREIAAALRLPDSDLVLYVGVCGR